jgi:hypothetical protein
VPSAGTGAAPAAAHRQERLVIVLAAAISARLARNTALPDEKHNPWCTAGMVPDGRPAISGLSGKPGKPVE